MMPVVYMSHPKHGRMPCTGIEVENNKRHGWTVDAEVPKDLSKETPKAPELTLEERYKQKFGKLPHHRMKPETIEAALNDME